MTKHETPTGFSPPSFGFGGGPIGGIHCGITEDAALGAIEAAWDSGIRYFDTAPWYGNTQSEHRLGTFLRQKDRDAFILTTKVGRIYQRPAKDMDFEQSRWRERWPGGLPMVPRFDYTRDGIMRSYEDSLQRLGINRVDALAIHDLDTRHHQTDEGVEHGFRQLLDKGGLDALQELKRAGDIKAIGAGINLSGSMDQFLDRCDLDYFLVAMPYTLAEQVALNNEFPRCAERGVRVVVGAPFASGILATGPGPDARYAYAPAGPDISERVAQIKAICEGHGISLASAALQFPLGHRVVAAVVFGAESADQVRQNVAAAEAPIPEALWSDLSGAGLIDARAPAPKGTL